MKKVLFVFSAFILSLAINAQTENDYLEIARDVLKTEKKAAIAEAMQLSASESTPFWELYNEYQGTMYLVQNKRIALINEFAENIDSLSDQKADEIWVNYMKYQQEVLKLKKSYYAKFKKILSAGKAARFMQLENKIETLINAQIAMEIPLIETK